MLTEETIKDRQEYLTITALSDSHELHRELDRLPGGDLLVHCGDFSQFSKSYSAIVDFAEWFADQPYRYKAISPGNHEYFLESKPARRSIFEREGIVVLINEQVELDGLRIWASPVTTLYGGAYGLSSPRERAHHWTTIPQNTDLLITHGPPLGILDQVAGKGEHLGDPELREAVRRVRPKLHVFGHVHGAYGFEQQDGTAFFNVALLATHGALAHQPMTLRLPRLSMAEWMEDSSAQEIPITRSP